MFVGVVNWCWLGGCLGRVGGRWRLGVGCVVCRVGWGVWGGVGCW